MMRNSFVYLLAKNHQSRAQFCKVNIRKKTAIFTAHSVFTTCRQQLMSSATRLRQVYMQDVVVQPVQIFSSTWHQTLVGHYQVKSGAN